MKYATASFFLTCQAWSLLCKAFGFLAMLGFHSFSDLLLFWDYVNTILRWQAFVDKLFFSLLYHALLLYFLIVKFFSLHEKLQTWHRRAFSYFDKVLLICKVNTQCIICCNSILSLFSELTFKILFAVKQTLNVQKFEHHSELPSSNFMPSWLH